MKQFLGVILICSIALPVSARVRDKIKIFAEAATFLNLNGADIKSSQARNMLRQKSTPGGNLGLGFKVKAPRNVDVQLSMGLRVNPQHLEFMDEGLYTAEKFVNIDYYLRFLLGYSFPLAGGTRMDIGLGFQNYYALNKRNTEGRLHVRSYTNTATGETLNYLSNIYDINWGDSRKGEDRAIVPFVFNPVVHLGLLNHSLLPGERQVGVALEFSSKLGSDGGVLNNNQGYIHRLDHDRNIIATETYRDQYTAISLTLSMVLF